MDIPPSQGIDEIVANQASQPQQGTVVTEKNELGMDDFFKLLTTQLVSQDPLEPMQDTEFISQMANFSSLSQMEAIAENTSGLREDQRTATMMNLIGKHVIALDDDSAPFHGRIDRVEWQDGQLMPYIGNIPVPYENIVEVSENPFEESGNPSTGEEIPPTGSGGI
ncbi:MAG: flagellar hook capping FlgD N-terminal domain-containing protein [Oceanipulchritudo sp.]